MKRNLINIGDNLIGLTSKYSKKKRVVSFNYDTTLFFKEKVMKLA